MKKRIVKQLSAWITMLALVVSMLGAFPLTAYAEGESNSLSLAVAVSNVSRMGQAYAAPGQWLKVEVTLQNAEWTESANGLLGFQYALTFDPAQVSPSTHADHGVNGTVVAGGPGGTWTLTSNNTASSVVVLGEAGNDMTPWGAGNRVLSTSYFTVNPGASGELAFGIDKTPGALVFDYLESADPFKLGQAAVSATGDALPVDATPPVVSLDGVVVNGDVTVYYKPVVFTATDSGAGFGSAIFNGKALAAGDSISANGTLQAYDAVGNCTTVNIIFSTILFDKAVAAIAKINEPLSLTDETIIKAARTAYDAVTDPAAKAKIDTTRLLKGEAFLAELEGRIAAANAAIDGLPAAADVDYSHKDAIEAARAQYNSLIAAGVAATRFPGRAALPAAENALLAIQGDVSALDADMGALPVGTAVTLAHETALQALQQRLEALSTGKQVPTSAYTNYSRLTDAFGEIAGIKAAAALMNDQFAALSGITAGTVQYADAASVAPVTAEKERLEARGVVFAEDVYTALPDYAAAKAAVDALLEEIALLNAEMEFLLSNWALNNGWRYEMARGGVSNMKRDYAVPDAAFTGLASLTAAEQRQAVAADMIAEAVAQTRALPTPVTYQNRTATEAIDLTLNALEAAPYNIPPATLAAAMTADGTDWYAAARLAYRMAHLNGPSTAPGNVALECVSYNTVKISWNTVGDAEGYYVYRATAAAGPYTRVAMLNKQTDGEYTDTGLVTGTQYYYYVTAWRLEDGVPYMSVPSATESLKPFVAAPAGLAVESGDWHALNLSWNKVEGATGYRVYRWDAAKDAYVLLREQTGTTYTHTGLAADSYTYVVSAYRTVSTKKHEGPQSAAQAGTALALPAVQSLAFADAGYHSVKLSWDAIAGATGYRVYRWDDALGDYKLLKNVTTNSHTDSKLVPASMDYRIVAYKTVGKVTFNAPVHADITAAVKRLAAPVVVKPSEPCAYRTIVPIHWSPVDDASGYNIYRHDLDSGTTALVKSVAAGVVSYEDALAPIGRFQYIITPYRTISKIKYEGDSAATGQVLVQGLAAPGLLTSRATGLNVVKLDWTPVDGAKGYNVYRWDGVTGEYRLLKSLGATVKAYTDNGVPAGEHKYMVAPYRLNGKAQLVDNSATATVQAYGLDPLQNLAALPGSYNTVKLTWDKVADASGYNVYRWDDTTGAYKLLKSVVATVFTYSDTAAPAGEVRYQVAAFRSVGGVKAESTPQVVTATALGVSAPLTFGAGASGYFTAALSWSKVDGATGYSIYRSTDANPTPVLVKNVTVLSYSDTGLPGKTPYTYYVVPYRTVGKVNLYGAASVSRTVNVQEVGVPQNLKAADGGYNAVKLTWAKVAGASGYNVYWWNRDAGDTGSWVLLKSLGAVLTYTHSGLPGDGTEYRYRVAAYRTISKVKLEGTCAEAGFDGVRDVGKPILTAAASGYNAIKLSWPKVDGASGYNIYHSADGTPDSFTLLKSVTTLTYTDTPLNSGDPWHYQVEAYRTVGGKKFGGVLSDAKSDTAAGVGVPPVLTATASGYNGAKLTWAKVTGANGYNVYRSATGEAGPFELVKSVTTNSYTDTALVMDQGYWYQVAAYRTVGKAKVESADKVTSTAAAVARGLAAPVLKTPAVTYSTVKLSWNKVSGASGYNIYRASYLDGQYTLVKSVAASAVSYSDAGLAEGAYLYKVVAYYTSGGKKMEGVFSAVQSAQATALPAPASITVAATTWNTLKVSWARVTGASGYFVYSAAEDQPYSLLATVKSGSTLSYTHAGIAGKYSYYVEAYYTANKINFNGKPTAPAAKDAYSVEAVGLTAAASGYNAIKLSWPKVNGASGYNVYRSADGTDGSFTLLKSVTALTYTDTPLDSGDPWYYQVEAYRTVGGKKMEGPRSTVETDTAVGVAAPSSFTAGDGGYNAVKLSWTEVDGATGYNVYRWDENIGDTGGWALLKSLGAVLTYTHSGLPGDGTEYKYMVAAYRTISKVKKEGAPAIAAFDEVRNVGQPALTATASGYNAIKLSWPKVDGASGYNIYRSADGTPDSYTLLKSVTTLTYTDAAIEAKEWHYRVEAYRTLGGKKYEGALSLADKATAVGLDAPVLTAQASGYNAVKLSWPKVADASGYNIYRYDAATDARTLLARVAATTTSYTHKNLLDKLNGKDVVYSYQIAAYRTVNTVKMEGPCSAVNDAAKATVTPLPKPTGLTVSPSGANALKVTWSAVPGAKGYAVYRMIDHLGTEQSLLIGITTATSYIEQNLLSDITYKYRVVACLNMSGSTWSCPGESSEVVTCKPDKLAAPTLEADNTSLYNAIKLSWSKVSGAKGYDVYAKYPESIDYVQVGTTTALSFTHVVEGSIADISSKPYDYYVVAYGAVEKGHQSKRIEQVTATHFPAPATATAVLNGYNAVKLSWSAVSGATVYQILRWDESFGPYDEPEVIAYVTGTSYSDTNLPAGKYWYAVAACRSYVEYGDVQQTVRYQTGRYANANAIGGKDEPVDVQNVPAATNVAATAGANYYQVSLSWTPVPTATGYDIFRSTVEGEQGELVANIAKAATAAYSEYIDPPATADRYYYTVRSYALVNGRKVYADSISGDTGSVQPRKLAQAPTPTAAAFESPGSVVLTWQGEVGLGYYLQRSTQPDDGYITVSIIAPGADTSFITVDGAPTPLAPETYYYRLVPFYRTPAPVREYTGAAGDPVSIVVAW